MRFWPILILLIAGCSTQQSRHVVQAPPRVERGEAPTGRLLDAFADAAAWKLYNVKGSQNNLNYEAADGTMHLVSDRSAGLIWKAERYDPRAEPLLAWRWKVSELLDGSSPLSPEFDNFPARLLVGFDHGWKDAGAVALNWRKQVEAATGFTPPSRAICYTFGGSIGSNEAVDAAFGEGRIVVINLRTPADAAGEWHTEVRDVASDYRAVFGTEPPPVMALGLGCDSHRMDRRVEAWFASVQAFGPEAYNWFRGELAAPPERRAPLLTWLILAACTAVAAASAGAWLWMLRRRPRTQP
jgi:hypothetical protein